MYRISSKIFILALPRIPSTTLETRHFHSESRISYLSTYVFQVAPPDRKVANAVGMDVVYLAAPSRAD